MIDIYKMDETEMGEEQWTSMTYESSKRSQREGV